MTFDRYIAVDWSAANERRTGRDSIWIATADSEEELQVANPSTRSEAMRLLEDLCAQGRTLVGFDFAFGYPCGSAALPGGGEWSAVWDWLAGNVRDGDDNRSNRFEAASRLNEGFASSGPFWGHPHQHGGRYTYLGTRKPDYLALGIRERRRVETIVPRAQPVWKLAYTGSVGSQALLGIRRLELWRRKLGSDGSVWPFETRFADDLSAKVVIAEIYPSLWPVERGDASCLDKAQVRALASRMRQHAREGRLEEMLGGPSDDAVRNTAITHEGWIYGVGDVVLRP